MNNEPTGPIELLEAYLDGALEPARVADIERQVARDAGLREMLASLRAQRDLRLTAWQSAEGSASSVARLVNSVRTARTRELVWAGRARQLRTVGAMAACLVIGFAVGRVAIFDHPTPNEPTAPSVPGNGMTASAERPDQPQTVVQVSDPNAGQHRVTLRDEHGQVIAVYSFDTAEQAQRFADDVNNWRPTQRRSAPSRPVPISGGF